MSKSDKSRNDQRYPEDHIGFGKQPKKTKRRKHAVVPTGNLAARNYTLSDLKNMAGE